MPSVKLNDAMIRRLPVPESGQVLYRDTQLAGLVVRIMPTGKRSFVVDKWNAGKVTRITLGDVRYLTTHEARDLARVQLGKIASGIDPVQEKKTVAILGATLSDVLDNYIETRKNLSERTEYDYRRLLSCYLVDWKDKPLLALDRDAVEKLHGEIGERSRAQANYAMRLVRALFNFAQERYPELGITESPTRRLSSVKAWYRVDRKQTYIKAHQLGDWWRATEQINDNSRDYFRVLLLTGLRKNEAAALKLSDIDAKGKTLTAIRKGNSEHCLPMGAYLGKLIADRMKQTDDSEFLFPSWGKTGRITEAHKAVAKVAEISGVPFALHDLRRTFATIAESLDISTYAVKRLLNHSVDQSDVTSGYIVTDVERLRKPMQQIEDFILAAAGELKTDGISKQPAKIKSATQSKSKVSGEVVARQSDDIKNVVKARLVAKRQRR